jgi:tetratricopeptide (TPR) repeat protein
MTNHDSDGMSDNDWEERRELSWTEADWEAYLAEHETAVADYLRHYEQLADAPDRIDEVAKRMGWDMSAEEPSANEDLPQEDEPGFEEDFDLYTVHRNPVHIATKAIYLGLIANWERIAAHPERVPPARALAIQAALFRGREHALQAVQSLDMGDYALAICFFKRALRELNETLSRLGGDEGADGPLFVRYREFALPRLFDLREIWLRVMAECRNADEQR